MNYSQRTTLNALVYDDNLDVIEACIQILPMKYLQDIDTMLASEHKDEWQQVIKDTLKVREKLLDIYVKREMLKELDNEKCE